MLTIIIRGEEFYDEATSEFVTKGDVAVKLEHSLASLSKWESIFEKPFLDNKEKSTEEILAYIKCMIVDEIAPEVFQKLSQKNVDEIQTYIDGKHTATWFNEQAGQVKSSEIITSELVYYWMTGFQIPFECENWNLNRLFTLIRVCNAKNAKPKKMTPTQMATRNNALNAARKSQAGSNG